MDEFRYYIGVKKIKAQPMNRLEYNEYRGWTLPEKEDGSDEGYLVEYVDNVNTANTLDRPGYVSWSPKEIFEAAYFPIKESDHISPKDITNFIGPVSINKVGEKTSLLIAKLKTGFEIAETSAPVDPKNYDQEVGTNICQKKIIDKVWEYLGFVLQWANNGLEV